MEGQRLEGVPNYKATELDGEKPECEQLMLCPMG